MIQKIQNYFLKTEQIILVLLLLIMILFSFVQVVLRQFFSAGILWADVFLRHIVIWAGFFGACIATIKEKHFAIDIVKKLLPEYQKYIAEGVTDVFSIIMLSLLLKGAFMFFMDDLKYGSLLFSINNIEIKSFWMTVIFPLGFALLLLHSVLQAIENMKRLFK